jgi:acyl-CoA synthetase (NDP forming)
MSGWREGPGSEIFEANPDLIVFRSLDSCFAAVAAWHRREKIRQGYSRRRTRVTPAKAAIKARALLAKLGSDGQFLTERGAKSVLAAYGVPVSKDVLATSAAEALAAARKCGYPVALKVESPDIPHKTAAGVIRLNLATPAAVRRAFAEIMAAARKVKGKARIHGVIVQPMAPKGIEIMIGTRRDPQFGPLVTVGMGGTLVEIMQDCAMALAPIGRKEARAMLESLRGHPVLAGYRNQPGARIESLVDIVCRVSELAHDLADRIDTIDINPVVAWPKGALATDALIANGSNS